MKKTMITLLLCLGFAKLNAQTFSKYADTANYLIHEIGEKKSLYVGKPLSLLLDSLKISPVDASSGNNTIKGDAFGATIFFDFNYERKFERVHYIIIDFDTPPRYSQSFPLFFPAAGGTGSLNSIVAVYKSLIVKDVLVKDYTNDEPENPGVHY